MQKVIYTDLDGTLLNHVTYSFQKSKPAMKEAEKKGVPVVFCTSKTRAEIELYRKKTGNKHPFISENGGAVFIPNGYFDFEFKSLTMGKYKVIELGAPIQRLRNALEKISVRYPLQSFGSMTAKQLAKDAGLSIEEAKLARKREYDEVFTLLDEDRDKYVVSEIRKAGLRHTKGGRYHHIMGPSDKGKAVRILTRLYKKAYGRVKTVGLGDSRNDFPMLESVDIPYLVQRFDGRYADRRFKRAGGIGPIGWAKAVRRELS